MTLEFSVGLIAICMVIFCVTIVYGMTQLIKTAQQAEQLLDHLDREIVPALRELEHVSRDLQEFFKNANRQIIQIESSVEMVEDVAKAAWQFKEDFVARTNKSSLIGFAAALLGIWKGKDLWTKLTTAKTKTKE